MAALLKANNIQKTFGHGKNAVHAVKGATFELEEGTITAVVGESGSGKSTLARLVLGLLPSTGGTLEFDGRDVTKLSFMESQRYWRDVQAVFQDPFSAFNQFFTVQRLLGRSMKLIEDKKEATERMHEALGHVGFEASDVLKKHPHELSGGQRQRIMIARALMMRPKLLLADEATSMLDASLRVNVLNVLRDLRDNLGTTVMIITHDIGQACYVAEQMLVMEKGDMVEQGSSKEVVFNPQHTYTKQLLADVPKLHGELGEMVH
ncbi:ABC transporter ATP-binding protein [Aestuariimicrobium ganziense]|uniref:ABC transporter ATP-binding protein n=1 Tax=Aestuariimicrobium ganziense TaxID=2773677 RepID=UPI001945AE96|nr:ABC transporter ATP-binding protein [Aestuariimicrobium ganziense]